MKKKLISSLLVFTMVAGLLTGCSGGASDSGSGDSSESENQSSEESGELQKVVIAGKSFERTGSGCLPQTEAFMKKKELR